MTTLLNPLLLLLLPLPQAVDGKADRKMEMRFSFAPWCEATQHPLLDTWPGVLGALGLQGYGVLGF